ncbi:U3 small nucleolar ribonucleoprotein IMP4-like [Histomonas meleagridis]|uniref:U3 small nucleolar ribonucleoprotein IMP4-like n=1 Tax=Histomonas meleagridis TaxID=135588 RepID=UPI003559AD84|nr:U3 small nucleolar ribonucleoprotein IMP4-like [Histomonas meleagridis]KAH0804463.1 U3 small nucleolar ribonucleoprotein IMP4-like [Histomonas meleagridis]
MSSARLRRQMREYVHSHLVQSQREATEERKDRLKSFMSQGKQLPRDIQADAMSLLKATTYDDVENEKKEIDDEYALIGVEDPKVAVTTSRDPSGPIKHFAREISQLIPNAQRVNRGATDLKSLVDYCRKHEMTDIVIVHGTHGDPDSIIVSHLPYGPTAYFSLANVVMRRQIDEAPPLSSAFPHLIFEDMTSKLGNRVKKILQALFPVPKPESRRVISFINKNDWISVRQHTFRRAGGKIELSEIGPRLEMRIFKIVQGTLEMDDADTEFALRSFIRSKAALLKAKDDNSDDE